VGQPLTVISNISLFLGFGIDTPDQFTLETEM